MGCWFPLPRCGAPARAGWLAYSRHCNISANRRARQRDGAQATLPPAGSLRLGLTACLVLRFHLLLLALTRTLPLHHTIAPSYLPPITPTTARCVCTLSTGSTRLARYRHRAGALTLLPPYSARNTLLPANGPLGVAARPLRTLVQPALTSPLPALVNLHWLT